MRFSYFIFPKSCWQKTGAMTGESAAKRVGAAVESNSHQSHSDRCSIFIYEQTCEILRQQSSARDDPSIERTTGSDWEQGNCAKLLKKPANESQWKPAHAVSSRLVEFGKQKPHYCYLQSKAEWACIVKTSKLHPVWEIKFWICQSVCLSVR